MGTPAAPPATTSTTTRPKRIRLRDAVKLAEDHALGILESTDDLAFWGEDWFDEHSEDGEWKVLKRAKEIVLNRIRRIARA
jgi:hypothetical protein